MNNISPNLRRCLFLLLLVSLVTPDGTAQRFGPRIVFASNRDGNWDIYSMDVNGNNLLQLTDHPTTDEYPACSPDGRRIAFRSERDGPPDLYVMDRDGNNVIRLTNSNFREGRPSWTPDGTKIAFVSGPQNIQFHPKHIFVMNADGTGMRNLTEDTDLTDSFSPSWSPDGKEIVFSSRPNVRVRHIYVMTAEGKRLKRLTEDVSYDGNPVYSPDGTKIAFESTRDGGLDGHWNIYLMDTDGTNVVKLTRTRRGTDNRSPTWLPTALIVNPNRKLPISWGKIKRTGNP